MSAPRGLYQIWFHEVGSDNEWTRFPGTHNHAGAKYLVKHWDEQNKDPRCAFVEYRVINEETGAEW